MNVNTWAVRAVARRIRAEAEKISSFTSNDIRRMRMLTQDDLQGLTADSILAELQTLTNDASAILSALYAVSEELMDYARRIDEADAKARSLIQDR